MIETLKKVHAIGLCSGGLDSRLAAKVIQEQGIDVTLISFETPFFSAAKAREAARQLALPLHVVPITDTYLEMLRDPPVGYGKYMNPCMDCHALMFHLAGELMREKDYDFLFSGEVLGQRPMSQTRSSLRYVEKHSGYDGYIVRPLSALRLPETIPERDGLVDRTRLLGITGRGRKEQMALAERFGITDYPAPAGGCLLTDKGYSRRLRDLFDHQETTSEAELQLLKHGRHFRFKSGVKVIVGRTKEDNRSIERYHVASRSTLLRIIQKPGPIVLVSAGADAASIRLAASICVGYSKVALDCPAQVVAVSADGRQERFSVLGIEPEAFKRLLI
jgi:tRNA U34 2-thiouridine synthase MnmA/TrmU